MEQLIVKYLNNELSHEEWEELCQWLNKSDLNKTTLNNIKSFHSNIDYEVEKLEDLVWEELYAKRTSVSSTTDNNRKLSHIYFNVAASIIFILAIALITYQLALKSEIKEDTVALRIVKKVAPPGQKITIRLPDGTMVTMNSGSEISLAEQFDEDIREVSLSGEAFFEVEHDLNKPFFVKMNGDKVRVLGTSFNIRSYPSDQAVYVSVATGKVTYSIPSGEEVVLESNQMAVYLPSEGSLSIGKVDPLKSFGWKDKIIYFKSTSFENVINELNRWYGVKINVKGNFDGFGPFTGDFRNESLEHVLKGLSYVYPFNFEINSDQVLIIKSQTKQ